MPNEPTAPFSVVDDNNATAALPVAAKIRRKITTRRLTTDGPTRDTSIKAHHDER